MFSKDLPIFTDPLMSERNEIGCPSAAVANDNRYTRDAKQASISKSRLGIFVGYVTALWHLLVV